MENKIWQILTRILFGSFFIHRVLTECFFSSTVKQEVLMEKFYSSLPAIIALAILAAITWYPRYRMMKHAANEAERDALRKRHTALWMTVSLIYSFGYVSAWHTLVFYTPLILMFDHLTQTAWLSAIGCGILFFFIRRKSIISLDWDTKKDADQEPYPVWATRARAFVNAKSVRTVCALLYSIGVAAFAIKLQSVWMIYFMQLLIIPAFFLLVFGIPLLVLFVAWIYITITEKYDDYKTRRRYSH